MVIMMNRETFAAQKKKTLIERLTPAVGPALFPSG